MQILSTRICSLLLVLLVSFVSQTAMAQFRNMEFEYLTVDNGLCSNNIRCIIRDSKGFLWIGTDRGLNRYDGVNIKVYENVEAQLSSLSDGSINYLLEDSRNNLWVGTANGLNLYNRKTDDFNRFFSDNSDTKSISHNYITSIIEDKDSSLWINTANGLNNWIEAKQQFNRFPSPGSANKLSKYQEKIGLDTLGNIWGMNGATLWRFNIKTKQYKSYSNALLNDANVQFAYVEVDTNGMVWIGINEKGLILFNPNTSAYKLYSNKPDGSGINTSHIPCMVMDKKRFLLIGGNFGSISKLVIQTNTFEYYFNDRNKEKCILGGSVGAIYKDMEGIFYAGSTLGVSVYNPKKKKFATFRHILSDKYSLINNLTNRFFEDSEGLIWISTEGGVSVFNPMNKTFKNFPLDIRNPNGKLNYTINSFAEDKNHDIWVGTYGAGIHRYNKKTGEYRRYSANPLDSSSITNNYILDVVTDINGNLLISYFPSGLDLLDIKKGVITKFANNKAFTNSLPDTWIDILHRINDYQYGLVTPKGYGVFDINTGICNWNKALSETLITDVWYDKKGNTWFATFKKGLWKISLDGQIEKYDKAMGFPSNSICGIVGDAHDNVWISYSTGICQYSNKTEKFRHYTVADGLQKSYSPYACLNATNGAIYFGGENGFNTFFPDSIKTNTFLPYVYIDEFQIFNNPVTQFTINSPLKHSISETKELVLSYKDAVFSFGFSAINFTNPEKAIYAYKMEGYDKKWNYTNSSRRFATYTNLDQGVYTFMVKATNNDGIWNEIPTAIKITINPPWWKTLWFRLLLLFFIISSALGFYFIRVNALKQYQRKLESKVKKRTLQLQEANELLEERQEEILHQNEEIHAKNESITQTSQKIKEMDMLKTRFFINISHEFRTPLTLVLGPIESMITEFKTNELFDSVTKLELVHRNAKRLLNLINQLIEIHKIESGSINLKVAPTEINGFITEIASLFQNYNIQQNISLSLTTHTNEIEVYIDKEKIERVIFNLLSNAFKYNKLGGSIKIGIKPKQIVDIDDTYANFVEISVTDTGIGISSKALPYIFEPFYQVRNSQTRIEDSSGIGLSLCKSLLELHKGYIEVQSIEGEGSTLIITLPLGKNHFKPEDIFEITNTLTEGNYKLQITDYRLPNISTKVNTPSPDSQLPTSDFRLQTILIVDDNADMRAYIKSELHNEYQIIEAADGNEGYKRTLEHNPELIISDVMMPGVNGIEFCNNIKTNELTSHIPVILLTAKNSEESTIEGFSNGADDYIGKPFSASILRSRIKNILHNREMMRQLYSREIKVEPKLITVNATDEKFMARVLKVVEDNIDNADFSVVMLAEETSLSRNTLLLKIKALTGENVNDFISSIRMKRAAQLLQTCKDISEIAYQVGFNDPTYFTKCFRKYFGTTPSKYRITASGN